MDLKPELPPIPTERQLNRAILRANFPIFLAEAFITFSVSGIMMTMLATSQIIYGDTGFHALEISLLITGRTWAVAFVGLGFGVLADRMPRKPIFILILLLSGLGRFLNGFAPEAVGPRYWTFFLCTVMIGFGQGGLMPAVQSYSSDAIEPSQRSRFFGIYESFRQIFQILGMILCAWMFQVGLWREYFWLTGVMLFTCAAMVAVVIKEPKRGSKEAALTQVLAKDGVEYRYRLNKETIRKTVLSRTNMIAYIEGIFTWIIFSIAMFLMYPYIQSPPYNISPMASSLFMILFGLPGVLVGAIVFSRISDRLAERDIFYRVNMIIIAIVVLYFSVLIIFIVPLPHITVEQGQDIGFLFKQYRYYWLGFMLFAIRGVLGLYHINQSPIIQKINLPEAQGTVMAWNQFLETIGMGLGPLIAGLILTYSNQNYLLSAVVSLSIGLPSVFLWMFARRWIHSDIAVIDKILKQRATELEK